MGEDTSGKTPLVTSPTSTAATPAYPIRTSGYTYADYLKWPGDERWELIHGVAWNMSPAPSPDHQRVLLSLARKIAEITDRTGCASFVAPFDVRLPDRAGVLGGQR